MSISKRVDLIKLTVFLVHSAALTMGIHTLKSHSPWRMIHRRILRLMSGLKFANCTGLRVQPFINLSIIQRNLKVSNGYPDKGLRDITNFSPPELEHRDAIDFRREWNVVFKVKRSLISHNFTIFFFLGDPGEEPCQWSTHNSLLGSFSTFKGQGDYCTNCASQEAADLYMKGAIDITEGIYTKLPEIRSDANLDCTKEIAALLNKHLTWRVMNVSIQYPIHWHFICWL